MFVGHYGVSFAVKTVDRVIPLWVLFLAVQMLDVAWSPLVLLGVEKVRIVPGITATNPLDLYYMPYTHSLVAGILWSAAVFVLYRFLSRGGTRASALVAVAVFSHWVLDFVVHRPDLALYDDTAKVGLGLWNFPVVAFLLEMILLFGGMWPYFRVATAHRAAMVVFGALMFVIQAYVFFGPPPASGSSVAVTAILSYVLFAFVIWYLESRPPSGAASGVA